VTDRPAAHIVVKHTEVNIRRWHVMRLPPVLPSSSDRQHRAVIADRTIRFPALVALSMPARVGESRCIAGSWCSSLTNLAHVAARAPAARADELREAGRIAAAQLPSPGEPSDRSRFNLSAPSVLQTPGM